MNNYGRRIADIEKIRQTAVSDARRLTESLSANLSGIALIDIDRFHDLNMALGRETCDSLLTESARRITAAMGPGELHREERRELRQSLSIGPCLLVRGALRDQHSGMSASVFREIGMRKC